MFTSRVLSALGIPCSHEKVFGGRPFAYADASTGIHESSWLAVPHLDMLPTRTLVVHQVRYPLDTIRSYIDSGWFSDDDRTRPLWKHYTKRALRLPASGRQRLTEVVRTTAPAVFEESSPIERAARFWVLWNELVQVSSLRCGHRYIRYRLEDMDADRFEDLVGRIGVAPGRPVQAVLNELGGGVNGRPRRSDLTLDQLGRAASDVQRLARSYEYEL